MSFNRKVKRAMKSLGLGANPALNTQDIKQQYYNLCAQAGELQYKIREFDKALHGLNVKIKQLNEKFAEIAQEESKNAPVQAVPKLKLPQTQEAMETLVEGFLSVENFPTTKEFKTLVAAFLQQSSEDDDTFDPALLARRIRKARANEFLFYIIHPDKKPKKVENEKVPETAEGIAAVEPKT